MRLKFVNTIGRRPGAPNLCLIKFSTKLHHFQKKFVGGEGVFPVDASDKPVSTQEQTFALLICISDLT